ncbi:ferredoxin [Synechococcus sp. PCC 7336]|uniref:(2Fe-2S) ferredoxin domain-containing protein n=1 Tax=Synechococcus sp. PCC 7336 TaxID=195250 RepID=UPI00034DAF7D|nr:(2Fe-2S) ferredoxin domain-containing protein [Synechococcus sp. PCC 7336]
MTESPTPVPSPEASALTDIEQPAASIVPSYGWHLFLCADQTKPKCCAKPDGLESWNYLKKRLKTLGLEKGELRVYRTKANCLRGCDYNIPGPVMLIYPGGYWYQSVTPEVVERILQEHVTGGIPVEDYLVAQTPLPQLRADPQATPSLPTAASPPMPATED